MQPGSEPKPRGFAAMTPERRRAVAANGGRAAHAGGRGHEWTPQQAAEAGRKGGSAFRRRPVPNDNPPVQEEGRLSGIFRAEPVSQSAEVSPC